MDAPCKIQGSIHVFRLVNNMCPGKWVHIKFREAVFVCYYLYLLHWIPLDLNSFMSMSIDLSIISSLDIYTIFL